MLAAVVAGIPPSGILLAVCGPARGHVPDGNAGGHLRAVHRGGHCRHLPRGWGRGRFLVPLLRREPRRRSLLRAAAREDRAGPLLARPSPHEVLELRVTSVPAPPSVSFTEPWAVRISNGEIYILVDAAWVPERVRPTARRLLGQSSTATSRRGARRRARRLSGRDDQVEPVQLPRSRDGLALRTPRRPAPGVPRRTTDSCSGISWSAGTPGAQAALSAGFRPHSVNARRGSPHAAPRSSA